MAAESTLEGKTALVAGATRGAGRAFAVELGRAGATVYVTGRSTRDGRSEMDRPETIEETAELVDKAGGKGVAVKVDHLDREQVKALVERIDAETGRLDVLINDVWGGDPYAQWGKKLWELDLEKGLHMLRLAIDTHIITSHYAIPLLIRRPGGLLIEITDGDNEANAEYRTEFFYDLAKVSVNRMAFAHSEELKEHGCTAVGLTPGFLRSEAMLDLFGITEENWRDFLTSGHDDATHFGLSETPQFVARAAVALATDPKVSRWNGQVLSSWELAKVYGYTDADGSRPDWGSYYEATKKGADPTSWDRFR